MQRRIVIAAPHSGSGKTTVTLALMGALADRGFRVQGFKVGPDYIDPGYHGAITHRVSRNLDVWMADEGYMLENFSRAAQDADISVIEGVMGLFDGKDAESNHGSTADVARRLQAPVILVVDGAKMARSAAAVVRGFETFWEQWPIHGVIINNVASASHYQLIERAIASVSQIPCLGYLARNAKIRTPERHLGLLPAIERGDLTPWFDELRESAHTTLDLDAIVDLSEQHPDIAVPDAVPHLPARLTMAVAYDAAFNFYYPENLDLLKEAGVTIKYFSPLRGEIIPQDADALYLGGGFPEEFLDELAGQDSVLADMRRRVVEERLPTLAECGGYMFLCDAIIGQNGKRYPMVGAIPAEVTMTSRLQALGYREITLLGGGFFPEGAVFRGHEFHYSTVKHHTEVPAYHLSGRRGMTTVGYQGTNLTAGYAHFYFPSNPQALFAQITHIEQRRQTARG